MPQPRVEIFAATMNAHTGETVRIALQKNHKGKMKLTDSQVVLTWLGNQEKVVKQCMRNRVVEILRFTDLSELSFVLSYNMMTYLRTRQAVDLRLLIKIFLASMVLIGWGKTIENSQ